MSNSWSMLNSIIVPSSIRGHSELAARATNTIVDTSPKREIFPGYFQLDQANANFSYLGSHQSVPKCQPAQASANFGDPHSPPTMPNFGNPGYHHFLTFRGNQIRSIGWLGKLLGMNGSGIGRGFITTGPTSQVGPSSCRPSHGFSDAVKREY